jgi:hypothetical protein
MITLRSIRVIFSLLPLFGSCALASAQAVNFVTNPTFTTRTPPAGGYAYDPTVNGWTFSALEPGVEGAGIADNGSAFGFSAALSGSNQVAFIQAVSGTAVLSQSITGLTPGDTYYFTVNLEGRPYNNGGAVTISTIGDDPDVTTLISSVIPPTDTWSAYSVDFTASSSTEVLTFSATPNNGGDSTTGIDAPSITQVPEGGAAWLYLLLAGAACFGAMAFTPRGKLSGRAQA